jgi:hypothetical protein
MGAESAAVAIIWKTPVKTCLFNRGRAKSFFFLLFKHADQALVRTHQIVPVPDGRCPFGWSKLARRVQDAWLSSLALLVCACVGFMMK